MQTLELNFSVKLFFFLSGFIVSVPITLFVTRLVDPLCLLLPLFLALVCASSIIAPLIEEFAKAYPFFYRYEIPSKQLMTLGFLTGLGFGIAEFFVYVFIRDVSFILRVHPIFFHAASTSIVAYGISNRSTVKFYFLAVILHFLNNFFATLGYLWLIGGIAASITAYYLFYKLFKKNYR